MVGRAVARIDKAALTLDPVTVGVRPGRISVTFHWPQVDTMNPKASCLANEAVPSYSGLVPSFTIFAASLPQPHPARVSHALKYRSRDWIALYLSVNAQHRGATLTPAQYHLSFRMRIHP